MMNRYFFSNYLNRSLANRINFWVLISVMGIVLVVGISSHLIVKKFLSNSIMETLQVEANTKALRLSDTINYLNKNVKAVSENSLIANSLVDSSGRDTYLLPFLSEIKLTENGSDTVHLTDFQGELIGAKSRDGEQHYSVAERKFVAKVLELNRPLIEVIQSDAEEAALMIGYPVIFPPIDMTEGVIFAHIQIDSLFSSVIPTSDSMAQSYVVTNQQGSIIWGSPPSADQTTLFVSAALPAIDVLESPLLSFEISSDISILDRALRDITVIIILSGMVLLVASSILTRYLSLRLTAPITELSKKSEFILDGQLKTLQLSNSPSRTDEIGVLTRTLNRLVASLQHEKETLEERVASRTQALEKSKSELRLAASVFEYGTEAFFILDSDGHVISINPALYTIQEELGISFLDVLFIDIPLATLDDKSLKPVWAELASNGVWSGELIFQQNTEDEVVFLVSLNSNADDNGHFINFIGSMVNITDRKRSEQLAIYNSLHDELTGLDNRFSLENHIKKFTHECNSAKRATDKNTKPTFTLMFMDLDNFKNINDTLGHRVGDDLLIKLSKRLLHYTREDDLVVRLGGDEFIIFLPHVHKVDEIDAIAGKIIEVVKDPFQLEDHDLYTSASIGISIFPFDGVDHVSLLKYADQAMYAAKANGKGTYHYFSESMRENLRKANNLETNLRKAIRKKQFELHYQPKVDLVSNKIYGFEALIRWQLNGEYVPPIDFITVAEKTGIIHEIGDWVLEQALRDCRKFHQHGYEYISVAVNMSPIQLMEPSIFDSVVKKLKRVNIDASFLEIEMTENILMNNTKAVRSTLARLSSLGVTLALDDFGTGYSSLSYLNKYPIDRIKIDQSFIRNIERTASELEIVNAIILMCQGLGIAVIAEGVETKGQLDILRLSNCHEIQGYYFSKPLPYLDALTLLNTFNIKEEVV